jgi:dipeptidyl aminopeptidase/acylaminoacyl peptidase
MSLKVLLWSAVACMPNAIYAQTSEASSSAKPEITKPVKPANFLNEIPVSAFAQIPFIDSAEISPNGEMMAGLFGINGEQRIAAFPIRGNRENRVILPIPDIWQVGSVRWVNDENLLVSITVLMPVEDQKWYVSRLLAVHLPTKKLTPIFWNSKGQNAADVLWVPSDGSSEILFAAQDSISTIDSDKFWPSVYKVDVTSGKMKRVVNAKAGVTEWSADADGNIRAGVGYNDDSITSTLYYRPAGAGNFKIVDRAKHTKDESLRVPFMFIKGTDNGYVFQNNDQGRSGIYEINLKTGASVKTIFDPKEGEVARVITSVDGTKLLGVSTTLSNSDVTWLDPKLIEMQAEVDSLVKGGKAHVESFNRDQRKSLLRISAADTAGDLYLYDNQYNTIDKIASINEKLGSRRLSPVKMIKYTARDGLGIEGVLTLPKSVDPKNLPLIVMPHGGPWAHDTLTYNYWAQFIASRGYAVLQPNFRGSTGYGYEFEQKGNGQMGFAMQDDITDGVKWAVAQGIADPKRVCIVGASYGGYAAMWGIIKDPELYRCAISIAGVSLLRRDVNDFSSSLKGSLYTKLWEAMTSDFNAVSPAKFADKIKAPLLLIHGKKDITVDHIQSEKMNSAMKKAGKSVEFVSIPTADHYFTREADRTVLLSSMEAFLIKHNPPN